MKLLIYPNILIGLLLGSTSLMSQPAQISGFVYNAAREPAMFSTIVLLNSDTLTVKGALGREDGSFLIENVAAGEYFIQVRNLEYLTYTSDLIKISKGENLQLEPVILSTAVNRLDEVVVTADKAVVEVHADKLVFNVSASASASGNNGLELLSKAPGVVVDMDNNIILQGKSGVLIFINGRPSRLSGNDLANLLEGLRSDDIETVEIITNPSSRYEAEGTAGIINIVMKKNRRAGTSGNIVSSYSQGNYGRGSLGTTMNNNSGKMLLNTQFSVSDSDFPIEFKENSEQRGYLIDMNTFEVWHRRGYNLSTGFDYQFDARNSISAEGRVFLTQRNADLTNQTGIMSIEPDFPSEILHARSHDEIPIQNYILNLNYRYIFSETSNLNTDVSYGNYSFKKNTRQPNSYFDQNMTALRSSESRYHSKTMIDLVSAMVEYEKKFGFLTVSTGVKLSFVQTGNNLNVYNMQNNTPVFDINRSNDFAYRENVAAAYFLMNAVPNKYLTLNLGIRLENTSSLGVLDSEIPTSDDRVSKSYNDFFPTFGISWNNQKNSVLSASIGRRITRPGYQDLNPFEYNFSELQSWKGNPFLSPNYITNYQLTWMYRRKLVISNTYSITRDFFSWIFIMQDEKGTILTPRNMNKVTDNGLNVSLPVQVFRWWEITTSAGYNLAHYTDDTHGINLKANIYNYRTQHVFKLPADIGLELTYYGNSPFIFRGSIQVEGFHGLNVGLRKSFLERKILLQLTGNDVFRTNSDYFYKSNYGGLITDGIRTVDNQRFGFSLTWNFGNQNKNKQRNRSAIDEELKRLGE
jgi:iron complex outermembrane recepter protein